MAFPSLLGVWGGHGAAVRILVLAVGWGLVHSFGLCKGTLLGHFFSHKPSSMFPHLPQPLGCSLQLD